MARIITKGLIGVEDINLGTSTFTRATSTGGTQILTQVSGASLGFGPQFQVFNANGTFTIPTGVTKVKITAVGGGGAGGGGTVGGSIGGGGGSGSALYKWLSGLTPGNTLAVTVGAGGIGVVSAAGNPGNSTIVASGTQTIATLTALGGAAGNSGAAPQGVLGSLQIATGGDLNFTGSAGQVGVTGLGGSGGGSIFGGGTVPSTGAGNGAFTVGGGGGGAGPANSAGGNGAAGLVIFEWVA